MTTWLLIKTFLALATAPLPPAVPVDAKPYHIRLIWDGGGTQQTVLVWPQFGAKRAIPTPLNNITVSNLYHTNSYAFTVTNPAGSSETIQWPQPVTPTNTIVGIDSAPTIYGPFGRFYSGPIPYAFQPGPTNTFLRVALAVTNDAWRYVGVEQPD